MQFFKNDAIDDDSCDVSICDGKIDTFDDIYDDDDIEQSCKFFDYTYIDSLEHGIIKHRESVKKTTLDKSDIIVNPLYGYGTFSSDNKLRRNFKHVLVVCAKKEYDADLLYDIFLPNINKNRMKFLREYLTICVFPMSILKNHYHSNMARIVKKNELLMVDTGDYIFDDTELVIPILDVLKSKLHKYLETLKPKFSVNDIIETYELQKYFNSNPQEIKTSLLTSSHNLLSREYWCSSYNSIKNIQDKFNSRSIAYKGIDISTIVSISSRKKDFGDEIVEMLIEKYKIKNNCDEKHHITNIKNYLPKYNYYVDCVINYKYFCHINNDVWTKYIKNRQNKKDIITDVILSSNDEIFLITIFAIYLVSKKLCDLVINNEKVLVHMNNIIKKHIGLWRYLFGYAWACMYIEEFTINVKMKNDDRFIFDINTASNLPIFPFGNDFNISPYLHIYSNYIIYGNNVKFYEINNLENFEKNFRIFTSGVFEGMDWSNLAASGSVMPSCVKKYESENEFNKEINDKYFSSDIDIICISKSTQEFIDTVNNQVIPCVTKNVLNLYNDNITVYYVLQICVFLTKEYVINNILSLNEILEKQYTADEIFNHLDNDNIKKYFYDTYRYHKNKKIKENDTCKEYNQLANYENMIIRVVNYSLQSKYKNQDYVYLENDLKIVESLKIKITSDSIKRNIEIFTVRDDCFLGCVSRFHLPCVRAYYDGKNVYMLPSFITSIMTNINMDYKYFAGLRNPIDIIEKYISRGFNIAINESELFDLQMYKKIKNKLTEPVLNDTMKLNVSDQDIENIYINENVISKLLLTYKTIDKNGDMVPFEPWIFHAYLSKINPT